MIAVNLMENLGQLLGSSIAGSPLENSWVKLLLSFFFLFSRWLSISSLRNFVSSLITIRTGDLLRSFLNDFRFRVVNDLVVFVFGGRSAHPSDWTDSEFNVVQFVEGFRVEVIVLTVGRRISVDEDVPIESVQNSNFLLVRWVGVQISLDDSDNKVRSIMGRIVRVLSS
jgi:hypothetical protein